MRSDAAADRNRHRRASGLLPLLCCLLAAGCGGEPVADSGAAAPAARPAARPAAGAEPFVELAAAVGLDFVHFNGMSGELLLSEITCGGGALADFDGDGDLDAYLLQGRMRGPGKNLADALVPPRHQGPLVDRLYRNDLEPGRPESLRFTDVTAGMGVAADGYGCAAAVGDADGDGRVDLYVANLGPDRLYRNLGGGRFADVTAAAGLGDPRSGVAAVFFDYDRDGRLDLFVGNNMAFDDTGAVVCHSLTGARDYCGPGAYQSQPDRLYRNLGGGRFADVTAASGLAAAPARPTLGAIAADLDGDGWQDLYVANDGEPNNLWINRRDGTFTDEAMLAGAAVNAAGASEASMGVDAGDFDADGDLDVFLTHLDKETNTLYRNDGGGRFADATQATAVGPPSLPFTSFGTAFVDYDNDGWLDLVVVNGAVTLIPSQVQAGDPFPLHQTKQLFRNLGPAGGGGGGPVRFEDVTARAGPAFALSEVGRGAAFGDVDEDGDTDVLVINNGGPARLLVNRAGAARWWLGLRLVTGEPPRDALGALVTVERRGGPPLLRRVHTDGSYSSASDPRVVVGLGDAPPDGGVERVRVRWPDGSEETFDPPPTGRYTTLRQGGGRPG
jgi:hypothetical protein